MASKDEELHLAALSSLKEEIIDLNSRFQSLTQERDLLEKQLDRCQLEKWKCAQETESRLDQQAQQYEQHLTELHSVIAVLTKKLESQKASIIREEDESSQKSNDTCSQALSNNNVPNESFSDNENISIDLSHGVVEQPLCMGMKSISSAYEKETSASCVDENAAHGYIELENTTQVSLEPAFPARCLVQIHELHSENSTLKERLASTGNELQKSRNTLRNLKEERDRLRKKVRELQSKLLGIQSQSSQGSQTGSPTHTRAVCVNSTTGERTPTSKEDAPITKIAERIKLKKMESGDRHILGSDFASLGVSNTKVVEHLVRPLQDDSMAQEIFQSFFCSGSKVSENYMREFEVEMERLNSRIEHLKAQNDLLCYTLEESKAHCNHMTFLIGKYESNATALQLALTNSDLALEAFDALVHLLESDIGLLLANNRSVSNSFPKHGIGSCMGEEGVAALLKKAQETRKGCEAIAKHLLQQLDRRNSEIDSSWTDMPTEIERENQCERSEEQRLRTHIAQLKNCRDSIMKTVVELESIHPVKNDTLPNMEKQKFDLENAVLVQELMAIKEEKADLKTRLYLTERECAALQLRLNSHEAQEQAYLAHIEHLKTEVNEHQVLHEPMEDNTSSPDKTKSKDTTLQEISQELADSLQREKKNKLRLQELVTTLEKVTKNSELRHQQSAEFVSHLKRANSALVLAFEKSKRKYQNKVKKLEQQMLLLVDRHTNQVQILKNRVRYFEDKQFPQKLQPNSNETCL